MRVVRTRVRPRLALRVLPRLAQPVGSRSPQTGRHIPAGPRPQPQRSLSNVPGRIAARRDAVVGTRLWRDGEHLGEHSLAHSRVRHW
jgi:hypothetical protein